MHNTRHPRWTRALTVLASFALTFGSALATLPAQAAPAEADATAATLTWGVKESFRNYIKMPAFKGKITMLGAAKTTGSGEFSWPSGTGRAATDASSGAIGFGKNDGIHFQSHPMGEAGNYALDITFKNPRVEITSASAATLRIDVEGREFKSMTEIGEKYVLKDVALADIKLPKPKIAGDTVTFAAAPTSLSAAGAKAFGGFYEAGIALDPLTLTYTAKAPAPVTPTHDVKVTGANKSSGLSVTVSGKDFRDLPAASTGRPASGVYVALRETTLTDDALNADPKNAPAAVTFLPKGAAIKEGAFTTVVTAPTKRLRADASYEIVSWSAHGALSKKTKLFSAPVKLTTAQRAALFGPDDESPKPDPAKPAATLKIVDATKATGLVINVAGTNYIDLPEPIGSDGKKNSPSGVYVALYDAKTTTFEDINTEGGALAVGWVATPDITDGAFSKTITVKADKLTANGDYQVITWPAHGIITPRNVITSMPLSLTAAQKAALGLTEDATPEPTPTPDPEPTPTSPEEDPAPAPEVTDGSSKKSGVVCKTVTIPGKPGKSSLSWGVKSSFVSYIDGGIAKGEITTSRGAARTGSGFSWGAGSGSLNDAGLGTISYPGMVRFTGHGGILDLTISNLKIKTTGPKSGKLIGTMKSQDMAGKPIPSGTVELADLSFTNLSSAGGSASVALTAEGAKAFAGFYRAGQVMDSLTFTAGASGKPLTEEICTDATGKRVNPDGTPYTGGTRSGGLPVTGTDSAAALAPIFGVLALSGAALLAVSRRRSQLGS